jgi:hypothetical protein
MPDPTNKFIKAKQPQKEDTTLSDNLRMVLEKHKRQKHKPRKEQPARPKPNLIEKASSINMGSPLYGKISSACKAAAKRKFKVWPSAYASGWGVRCTKAGGPSKFGGGKKK